MHKHGKISSLKLKGKEITIALAGNANVGKSVIFNQLTGSKQIIGNWPGKTVELAYGKLNYKDNEIILVDLPGIYSLTTYTQEEEVTRKFIAKEKPDIVINVIDASTIERNLYFTLQLIEMDIPLIICLNQIDMADKKGLIINFDKLSELLGVPVIPTVAIKGVGLKELIDTALKNINRKPSKKIKYSRDIEDAISKIIDYIEDNNIVSPYSPRFTAIKLLEGDQELIEKLNVHRGLINYVEKISNKLMKKYGQPTYAIIASQRYMYISSLLRNVLNVKEPHKTLAEYLDVITTHKIFGFLTSLGVIISLLLWTFYVGDFLSSIIEKLFNYIFIASPNLQGTLFEVFINGALGGVVAGITLVIPYVLPFYLFLSAMEDSGIMTRIAFMLDTLMHKIGLHGKAIIPIILGYGCAVPGIFSTRILETRRERILASLAITMVPCSARTVVILGLVAAYLGVEWALLIYGINIAIILIIDYITSRMYPGETPGLILEIHEFRIPSLKVIFRQTINRTMSIIYLVFPLYIVGSGLIQVLYKVGIFGYMDQILSPITHVLMGLPTYTGTLLIFGFIRKELILLLLPQITGTFNLTSILTPQQIFSIALISTIYIPCISTMATLIKEFGPKDTMIITILNISTAIFIGTLLHLFYTLFP